MVNTELIVAKDLSYKIENKQILTNLNFTINSGEITYIVGANGSGKSTLSRILAGITSHYNGTISYSEAVTVSYLPTSETGLFFDFTGIENINYFSKLLGISSEYIKEKISLWSKFKVFQDSLNTNYIHCSRSMKFLLRLFIYSLSKPTVIILDESQECLSEENAQELFTFFQKYTECKSLILCTPNKSTTINHKTIEILN